MVAVAVDIRAPGTTREEEEEEEEEEKGARG